MYARLSAACLQVIDRVMLSRAGLTVPGPDSTLEQHQQHALYVLYLLAPSPFLLMSRIYQHRQFRYRPHLLCHHPNRLMCRHHFSVVYVSVCVLLPPGVSCKVV